MNDQSIQCLSNHGLILVSLSADPEMRIRDLAEQVGLTERAVQRLVTQLVDAGLIERQRQGRRNRYEVRLTETLADPLPHDSTVADLVSALANTNRGTDPIAASA